MTHDLLLIKYIVICSEFGFDLNALTSTHRLKRIIGTCNVFGDKNERVFTQI